MAASLGHVLAQIQHWVSPRLEECSDAQLLERFIQDREESAFAALVARHGAMVLRSCRRILGDGHEAEDAFQATFLILARKAQSLRQPDALPGYLHSIARRVALKARARTAVHTRQSPLPANLSDPRVDPLARLTARELLTVLDEEVARLPSTQRSAVVLCCLEGRTQEEAARLLGWTAGSLRGHLERGRNRLQARLLRRGITLPAALAIVAVSRSDVASAPLFQNTVKAALHGGIGSTASALAHSVLQAMLLGKLASVMAVVLTISLAASTTVALVYRGSSAEAPKEKLPTIPSVSKDDNSDKPQARTDAFGDSLPDGAFRRLGTLRFRHGGGIETLLPTPDGKILVSRDYYGTQTVCVWEMATGKLLHRLPGTYEQKSIALSLDGKLVAVGQKKAIVLWDLVSGKEVRRLAQTDTFGFAFSPDGKFLAAGDVGPCIHLWDLATGNKITRFKGNRDPISVDLLALTVDGKTLIAGKKFASRIGLWDVSSGEKRRVLDSNSGEIFMLALSPDGALLATGSRKGGIPLWNVRTGELVRKLGEEGRRECYNLAFSPNGKTLAAIERDAKNQDSLSLWDVTTGKELNRFERDLGLWSIAYAPDGKTLIVASVGAIRLLDAATGKEIGPTAGSPSYLHFVTMSPDGRTLAFLRNHDIRLWDTKAGREIGSIDVSPHGIRSLAFTPDGRTAAASTDEYDIKLWDVRSRKLLRRLQRDKKETPNARWGASEIAFSPDGLALASADTKGPAIRLWEISSGKQVRQFDLSDPHAPKNNWAESNGIAFSPDGRLLAASGRTGFGSSRVAIWEIDTGKELSHLTRAMNDPSQKDEPSHSPGISMFETKLIFPKVAFSPNGRMLVKNGRPKTIAVWEAATGQQRLLLKGHEESTVCVAFAPDGRTLASASWDETVRLWDLDTGRELRKLTGHRGKPNSLAFTGDGKVLVSSGDDTTMLFWDVADVTHRKRRPAAPLAVQQWQALWEDLAGDDATKAYAAMVRMTTDGPTTIAAVKKRLRPIRPVDPQRLARLLKELDSDEFSVRESASGELEKLGDVIEPTIRQMLARPGLALESRQRLESLAKSLDEISGERLRQLRALEVLQMLGTPEAGELLKAISEGASGAQLTEQAKAALKWLKR